MKKLTNDEKEQILIRTNNSKIIDSGLFLDYLLGINNILNVLGYADRLTINFDKGIFEWRSVYDH